MIQFPFYAGIVPSRWTRAGRHLVRVVRVDRLGRHAAFWTFIKAGIVYSSFHRAAGNGRCKPHRDQRSATSARICQGGDGRLPGATPGPTCSNRSWAAGAFGGAGPRRPKGIIRLLHHPAAGDRRHHFGGMSFFWPAPASTLGQGSASFSTPEKRVGFGELLNPKFAARLRALRGPATSRLPDPVYHVHHMRGLVARQISTVVTETPLMPTVGMAAAITEPGVGRMSSAIRVGSACTNLVDHSPVQRQQRQARLVSAARKARPAACVATASTVLQLQLRQVTRQPACR